MNQFQTQMMLALKSKCLMIKILTTLKSSTQGCFQIYMGGVFKVGCWLSEMGRI